ncbi:MAG: hypothetical protein K1X79_11100 [Oligoflexia bacterium]|nr:hypothetical protein [Oligoflexia bacterium]
MQVPRENPADRLVRRSVEEAAAHTTDGSARPFRVTLEVDGRQVTLDYRPGEESSFEISGRRFGFGAGLGEIRAAAQRLQLDIWQMVINPLSTTSFSDYVVVAMGQRAGQDRMRIFAEQWGVGVDPFTHSHDERVAVLALAPPLEFVVPLPSTHSLAGLVEIAVVLQHDHVTPSQAAIRWVNGHKVIGRPRPFTYGLGSATRAAVDLEKALDQVARAAAPQPVPAAAAPIRTPATAH